MPSSPCHPSTSGSSALRSATSASDDARNDFAGSRLLPGIFEEAIHQKLDALAPGSEARHGEFFKLSQVLDRKLTGAGDLPTSRHVLSVGRRANATAFGSVFRHGVSGMYSVKLSNGQTVVRTRDEIEMHVLLQSHLRALHHDNTVSRTDVLTLQEIFLEPCNTAGDLGSDRPGFQAGNQANESSRRERKSRGVPEEWETNVDTGDKSANHGFRGLGIPQQVNTGAPKFREKVKAFSAEPAEPNGFSCGHTGSRPPEVSVEDRGPSLPLPLRQAPHKREVAQSRTATPHVANGSIKRQGIFPDQPVMAPDAPAMLCQKKAKLRQDTNLVPVVPWQMAARVRTRLPHAAGSIATGVSQTQQASTHTYRHRPEDFKNHCLRAIERARDTGAMSIVLPSRWLPRETKLLSPGDARQAPVSSAFALVVAAVARYCQIHSPPLPQILFECESTAEKALFERLILQARNLSEEPLYQALLRGHVKRASVGTSEFTDKRKTALCVPTALRISDTGELEISPASSLPKSLNNIAFGPCAQSTPWPGDKALGEPQGPNNHIKAAGVVIVEENGDGRVWVVEPTNQFMDLTNTFPKGRREPGLTPQQTAIKEAREESGLDVELVGFLCDAGTNKATRYFLARRIGGSPVNAEWESQGVKLIPQNQLLALFQGPAHFRDFTVAQKFLNFA